MPSFIDKLITFIDTGTLTGTTFVGNLTGNVTGTIAQTGVASASASTITATTGTTNTATLTIQLKDAAGTNVASIQPFELYLSSASTGLTLASAASTGLSVASGGMKRGGGEAITQAIKCVSSATGGCVISLLDTGKSTSYPCLLVGGALNIGTQLTSGNYG